jgi:hypothetical protein
MVERGKGPTESPRSEAKNALVTADWSEVSSILWTQVNGVVKRKRETYATNTQTV